MSRQLAKRSQQLGHSRGRTWRIWISRMSNNTQNAVLGQRAGCPGFVPFRGKPGMGAVMQQVGGIDQSNQDVHIQEEPGQGSSSRSRRTSSEVTRGAPLRTLSRGTPFRVRALVSAGDSARLAREEITSPTDFCSVAAISFAALSTSSSITSVVRTVLSSRIIHQMLPGYKCSFMTNNTCSEQFPLGGLFSDPVVN